MIWRENWKPYTALILGVLAILMVFWYAVPVRSGEAQCGTASWYGPGFHGRTTASGETYNMHAMTAAHPSIAFGTRVKVIASKTGKSATVTITDRGPFYGGRIIDLSKAAAQKLGIIQAGTGKVCLTRIR
jgi:rare lipoprotein A